MKENNMVRELLVKSRLAFGMAALVVYSFVGCSQNMFDPVAFDVPGTIQFAKAPSASIQTIGNGNADKEFVRLYLEKLRKDLSSGKTLQQIGKERGAKLMPVLLQHPSNAWVQLGNGQVVPVQTEQNGYKNHQAWNKKNAGGSSILSYPWSSGSMTYLFGNVSPNPSVYNPPNTLISVHSSALYILGANEFYGSSSCALSTDVTGRLGANQLWVLHELYANNMSGYISGHISSSDFIAGLISGSIGAGATLKGDLPDGHSGTRYFVASYFPVINGSLIADQGSFVYANSFFSVVIP